MFSYQPQHPNLKNGYSIKKVFINNQQNYIEQNYIEQKQPIVLPVSNIEQWCRGNLLSLGAVPNQEYEIGFELDWSPDERTYELKDGSGCYLFPQIGSCDDFRFLKEDYDKIVLRYSTKEFYTGIMYDVCIHSDIPGSMGGHVRSDADLSPLCPDQLGMWFDTEQGEFNTPKEQWLASGIKNVIFV